MIRRLAAVVVLTAFALAAVAGHASAQSLGTFTWQLQPYCNVITVTLTQQGSVYALDGYDDQCNAVERAPFTGQAVLNPDGSIALGLSIVTAPSARAVHVSARIPLPALSGTWSDDAGNQGTLAFGQRLAGQPREVPSANGQYSTAIGLKARASGAYSTAIGNEATATGANSTALGPGATAGGVYATALGNRTAASGEASTAMGSFTQATGDMSLAGGEGTVASGRAALAMGQSSTASGAQSTAFGAGVTAGGLWSLAAGFGSRTLGDAAVALGLNTVSAGAHALAMGDAAQANGGNSVAMGAFARALGFESFSLGQNTTALGNGSFALGSNASAAAGSFAFGDRSTSNVFSTAVSNQFAVRATGGVAFYTNAALSAGVSLAPGGGAWSNLSDARMKQGFRDLDGEDVLQRLARMPVREWSYTTQDAGIRHVGPTAQDFHAAFGLGESDVRINTVDADGVALAAARALEARTAAIRDELGTLRHENEALKARLARLEQLLDRK